MRLFAVLLLAIPAAPGFGRAQTLPQPIVTVSAEVTPATAHPTRKIVRLPWQTGIFQ